MSLSIIVLKGAIESSLCFKEQPASMLPHLFIMILITSAVTNKGDLYFITMNESIDEDNTIPFLEQLLSEIDGFTYIFWVNTTIPRGKNAKIFIFDNSNRIITRRIPSHSPELNPDICGT
ncbi:MAG: transposase [Candidatus Micrarchaeaceae archaeon]